MSGCYAHRTANTRHTQKTFVRPNGDHSGVDSAAQIRRALTFKKLSQAACLNPGPCLAVNHVELSDVSSLTPQRNLLHGHDSPEIIGKCAGRGGPRRRTDCPRPIPPKSSRVGVPRLQALRDKVGQTADPVFAAHRVGMYASIIAALSRTSATDGFSSYARQFLTRRSSGKAITSPSPRRMVRSTRKR